jgi:hypothetical protein
VGGTRESATHAWAPTGVTGAKAAAYAMGVDWDDLKPASEAGWARPRGAPWSPRGPFPNSTGRRVIGGSQSGEGADHKPGPGGRRLAAGALDEAISGPSGGDGGGTPRRQGSAGITG